MWGVSKVVTIHGLTDKLKDGLNQYKEKLLEERFAGLTHF